MKIILLPIHFPAKIHILFEIFERKNCRHCAINFYVSSSYTHHVFNWKIVKNYPTRQMPGSLKIFYIVVFQKGCHELLRTNSNSVTATSTSTGSFTKLSKWKNYRRAEITPHMLFRLNVNVPAGDHSTKGTTSLIL